MGHSRCQKRPIAVCYKQRRKQRQLGIHSQPPTTPSILIILFQLYRNRSSRTINHPNQWPNALLSLINEKTTLQTSLCSPAPLHPTTRSTSKIQDTRCEPHQIRKKTRASYNNQAITLTIIKFVCKSAEERDPYRPITRRQSVLESIGRRLYRNATKPRPHPSSKRQPFPNIPLQTTRERYSLRVRVGRDRKGGAGCDGFYGGCGRFR